MTHTQLIAIACVAWLCSSLFMVMVGVHNIDNAVNMAVVEQATGGAMTDSNLFLTMDKLTLYMVGGTLVMMGIIQLTISGLLTGHSITKLREQQADERAWRQQA